MVDLIHSQIIKLTCFVSFNKLMLRSLHLGIMVFPLFTGKIAFMDPVEMGSFPTHRWLTGNFLSSSIFTTCDVIREDGDQRHAR